jgi:hypothetical protein
VGQSAGLGVLLMACPAIGGWPAAVFLFVAVSFHVLLWGGLLFLACS